MIDNQRILVLAPHPDDGEFGCGGAITKWIEAGKEVFYAVFSPCNKSLPEGFPPDSIYNELDEACKTLGIAQGNVIKYRFPVREFSAYRQEILENMVLLRKEINPQLILLPNREDIHQDHHQIHLEGIRAFKQANILGYELPWNSIIFRSNCLIRLHESHIENKVKALGCYASQHGRLYAEPERIKAQAKMRGTQANANFAEAFDIIKVNL